MRNLTMMRAAATLGPVDMLTFGDTSGPASDDELAGLCRRFERLPRPRRMLADRGLAILRSNLPDMAHRLWSDAFNARFQQWLAQHGYDIVQVEGIELARYVTARRMASRPCTVFDDHNVEFLLQERAYGIDRARLNRLHSAAYSAVQARRLRGYERLVCESADAVIAVSEEDAAQLRSNSRSEPVVIPNAIDLSDYPFDARRSSDGCTLLFPGTMDFRPNADAAIWFVEAILPRLVKALPNVQCFFAGRRPQDRLVRYGQRDARIAVTGEVPSMLPYWDRATLCILPLQVGGGSRFKAIEAMALGVPIVSTSLGMEGIHALAGRDYLRADDAASFAQSVLRLVDNPGLQRSLAKHARQVVERGYTQAIVTERLTSLYQQLHQ
jgi:glycosyltransferase involved in cell wall biosynthesis